MHLEITIRKAVAADRIQVAELRHALWPDGPVEEHLHEFDKWLATGMGGTLPAATFVAEDPNRVLVGFLDVGMRSHADNCDVSQPVGYVEGWYVAEALRNRGIGRELLKAAEDWARAQGCKEMASDAQLDNQVSLAAHEALGFEVVERCYLFRKTL